MEESIDKLNDVTKSEEKENVDEVKASQYITGKKQAKGIAVIGDEDTCIAFSLTGIKHITILENDSDKMEIMMAIKGYIKTPEIGFIIITQQIAESIRSDLEKLKQGKPLYPIILEIPDKKGEVPGRTDPISLLIRRAIGMEVMKK